MSIASEITRLQTAKADLKAAIEAKGVTIPSSTTLEGYPELIGRLPNGGYDIETTLNEDGTQEVHIKDASSTPKLLVEKDVNFYDFDGLLVYSFEKNSMLAMDSLPDPPDHSGDNIPLVFDGWNYSLEDIENELEYTSKITIGANYHTTDNLTHLVWNVEAGDQVRIQSVSSGAVIDWGDGETTTGQTLNIYHTYTNAGIYDCKVSGSSIIVGHSYAEFVKNYARLSEVRLSNGITAIGDTMFRSCHSLQNISIPQSVTSIRDYTFTGCSSLKFIAIPHGVTSTGSLMLGACHSLQDISIPRSVTSIGSSMFSSCYSLQDMSIPQNVTSINSDTFYDCNSLQSVNLPNRITSIVSGMFRNCYSLKSITIPQGVTDIGSFTFNCCYSLQRVTIPQSVTNIGNNAFGGCYFGILIFESTIPPTVSSTNVFVSSNITKIVVPKGCLEAYQNATNLSQMASKMVEADE